METAVHEYPHKSIDSEQITHLARIGTCYYLGPAQLLALVSQILLAAPRKSLVAAGAYGSLRGTFHQAWLSGNSLVAVCGRERASYSTHTVCNHSGIVAPVLCWRHKGFQWHIWRAEYRPVGILGVSEEGLVRQGMKVHEIADWRVAKMRRKLQPCSKSEYRDII